MTSAESTSYEGSNEQHVFSILAPINAGGMMHCEGIITDASEADPFWGIVMMKRADDSRGPKLTQLAFIRSRAIGELANRQVLSYITQVLVDMRRSLVSKTNSNSAALIVILLASKGYTLTSDSMPGASSSEIKHLWATIDTVCLRPDPEALLLYKWVGGRTSQGYYEAVERDKAVRVASDVIRPSISEMDRAYGSMSRIAPASHQYYYDDVLREALGAYVKTKFS